MDPNYVGEKVIVRSNEDEPALVGTLTRWEDFPGGSKMPVVEIEGKGFLVMGVLLPYHEGLLALLNSMAPKDSWELAKNISILCQIRTRQMSR